MIENKDSQSIKNYGYVSPMIEGDHYIFGGLTSLPKIIIQPDGSWKDYLPVYEPQFNKFFDSYGCTVFGTENGIEILQKKISGGEPNYSERFVYILADIIPPGADPHKIAEIIRKNGLINDTLLPMVDSYTEFRQPFPMTPELLDMGKKWDFEFGHEWVFVNNPSKERRTALFKECLQYSPLCVSVTAWREENGIYVDDGLPNTHWCVLYGREEKDGEVYPLIFDSYDQSLKKLHPNHHIESCKRYVLMTKEIELSPERVDCKLCLWLDKVINFFKKLWQN